MEGKQDLVIGKQVLDTQENRFYSKKTRNKKQFLDHPVDERSFEARTTCSRRRCATAWPTGRRAGYSQVKWGVC